MKKTFTLFLFIVYSLSSSFAQKDSLEVFTIVDEKPQFPGGDSALKAFLEFHIQYPLEERETATDGIVYVTFVIDTTGKAREIKLLRSAGPYFDAEAIRVVNKMPAWTPGKIKGRKVNVLYNLPVKFTIIDHTVLRDYKRSNSFYDKGLSFLAAKEYDKAIESFSSAIKADKMDIDAYYNRAVCYVKMERNTEACADLQKAKELGDKESGELFLKLCVTPAETPPDTTVKQNIVENPAFPGGNKAFSKYIDENLIYPEEAGKKKIEGTVEVGFTIDENGKIRDAIIVKSLNESCDAEALRFVNTMPDWVPGKQNGKPGSFQYNLPLGFFKKK
jgi:TonB family protein